MSALSRLLREGRLLLEAPKLKKVPLSQRSPGDQAKYWVGTALSALKAGSLQSASESLERALKISGYPDMNRVRPLVTKALELSRGPEPRAADSYVEKAYKILKP